MSSAERARKPRLDRTSSIRSWATLFGSASAEARGAGAAAQAEAGGSPSVEEALSRSVDLGYRVVDEYIRQGQNAARRLSQRAYDPAEAASEVQELVTRMGQYASDFASLWIELVDLAAAGSVARRSSAASDGAAVAADGSGAATNGDRPAAERAPRSDAADPAGAERIRIELSCSQRADVSLELQAGAARRPVLTHALRAVDPDKPRLTEVSLSREDEQDSPVLRLHVPDDQPAGIYSGLLIDQESGRPVGTVSVRIAGP